MSDDVKATEDHAKMTLFVRGLPFEATSKDLEDFFGEIGPIRKCFVVADKSSSEPKNKGFGYVHYALEEDAQSAIDKLKNTKFMGRKLKIDFAKRKSETVREEKKKEEPKPVAKRAEPLDFDVNARLIIRNLPWKYRESDLRKMFEKHGVVHDVKLPRKYEGGPLRGFAFIQFEDVDQAKAAMEAINATEHHGRTVAVDWSIPKTQYRQIEENETAATEETQDTEMKEADEDKEESSSDDSEEENDDSDEEEEKENEDVDMDQESDEGSEEDDSEEEGSDKEDEDSDEEEAKEEVKAQDKKKEKKKGTTVEEGTTLFVRNLLFESTEEDLKELFKQWGPVVYAKITRDPTTKLSRGTGFVCMRKKEDTDKILEAAENLRAMSQKDENNDKEAMDSLLSKREKKKKGLMYKSLITPESGSGEGAKFTLHGRVLDVTLAVDRKQAKQLKDDNLSQKRKEDKRNLYLMREGVIFPDTPAAETLTLSELSKRQMSFSSRKKLVSNNPSLYISKTRLSIRNLPTKVTDTELKSLGMSSISKFKNEVKAGLRDDLTKDEKEDGWHLLPRVKQAKIIRSNDRIDTATNQLRSKGYGFLEFNTHSHSLAALRYLNNNPDIFKGKRLIVEFSLENKEVTDRRTKEAAERKSNQGPDRRGNDRREKGAFDRRDRGGNDRRDRGGNDRKERGGNDRPAKRRDGPNKSQDRPKKKARK